MTSSLPITIAIPTYRRERILVDSIDSLLRLERSAREILVLDQTIQHMEATEEALKKWSEQGRIRWLRLARPSIPAAMNQGLLRASQEIVLFLDDDIVPHADLVAAHVEAHGKVAALIAGRVLQPWDRGEASASWAEKRFASTGECEIDQFMGGNFSLRRSAALAIGGFDENFVCVAYHFEREFADRWRARGGRMQFYPDAAIRHLKASAGGTRTYGEHLTTLSPAHSVGAYYYLLRSQQRGGRLREFLARPWRAVMTRHHLRGPWWIPVTLCAELAGMLWAVVLFARGPRYCVAPSSSGN